MPRYVETVVYHTILEAIASETLGAHGLPCRTPRKNALELVDDLTLELNKARQEMITSELLDIIGGVAGGRGLISTGRKQHELSDKTSIGNNADRKLLPGPVAQHGIDRSCNRPGATQRKTRWQKVPKAG